MSFIISSEFIEKAVHNLAENQHCKDLHPGTCTSKALLQMKMGTRSIAPLYFMVHLIPLILKHKRVSQNPGKQLKKFGIGFLKSMLFVTTTLFFIRRFLCLWTQFYKFTHLNCVYTGFILGFPLMLESPGRQMEIGLYNLNKGTQILYLILLRRYPNLYIKHGECWLFAISAAIIAYYYLSKKQLFKQGYQKMLDVIFDQI